MFVIMSASPVYDNRDGICGTRCRQANPYAFETLALAQRMLGRQYQYDDDGYPLADETDYFVADTSDPWRRRVPVATPAAHIDDDLPF